MYTLYYRPFACSLAVHVALEKIGQPYDLVNINFEQDEQHSAEYLEINPLGQVPVLGLEGRYYTQLGSLLILLDRRHPQAKLLPQEPSESRTRAIESLFYLSNTVHPIFSRAFFPERVVMGDQQDAVRLKAIELMCDVLAKFESHFAGQDFYLDKQVYAVDYFVYAILQWPKVFKISLSPYTHVKAFLNRMNAIPEMQRALMSEMQVMGHHRAS